MSSVQGGKAPVHTLEDSVAVVTGGAGFIGSHLAAAILERGCRQVRVIDSFHYGKEENLWAVLNEAHKGKVSVHKFCLGTDPAEKLAQLLSGAHFLFHLAAEKHNQSKHAPSEVFRSNINGTFELYDAAAQCGIKKILYTSSLYAYGRTHGEAFKEAEVPRPETIYGISKLCGEHLLTYVGKQYGIESTAVRYLFVYGPRQFAGTGYKSVVVKNFQRILAGERPCIYGDGRQALDYIFVDDAVEATLRAFEAGRNGETYNIGSGTGSTIENLTALMCKVAGVEASYDFAPADWTQGTSRVGDISKTKRELGWTPRTPLETGLRKTFDWIREENCA